jgi:hypothetical protein
MSPCVFSHPKRSNRCTDRRVRRGLGARGRQPAPGPRVAGAASPYFRRLRGGWKRRSSASSSARRSGSSAGSRSPVSASPSPGAAPRARSRRGQEPRLRSDADRAAAVSGGATRLPQLRSGGHRFPGLVARRGGLRSSRPSPPRARAPGSAAARALIRRAGRTPKELRVPPAERRVPTGAAPEVSRLGGQRACTCWRTACWRQRETGHAGKRTARSRPSVGRRRGLPPP